MATFVKTACDEGVIRSAPEAAPSAPRVGVWVLVATILGSSMAFIDGSVVNVALPVIQRDFNATATNVQWVVEAYSLFGLPPQKAGPGAARSTVCSSHAPHSTAPPVVSAPLPRRVQGQRLLRCVPGAR